MLVKKIVDVIPNQAPNRINPIQSNLAVNPAMMAPMIALPSKESQ